MRKDKQYHYIYKTTNLLNGRYYYGMHSTDIIEDGYLGSGTYLRRAIKKHGKENFNREIIEYCKTRTELKSREIDIVNLQEVANKNCYNCVTGGEGVGLPIGYEHTEETRNKMSESRSGENHWNYGKLHSPKTRKKISDAHLGLKRSEESCKKQSKTWENMSVEDRQRIGAEISKRTKGELNGFYGKTHTDEVKKVIREKRKLQEFTEETKAKLSKARTGYITPQETKDKISKANKGKSKPESMKRLFGNIVYQYDLNNNFINEYYSLQNAADNVSVSKLAIWAAVMGRSKTSAGYKWSYTKI